MNRLRELREARGLTMKQLSEVVNIPYNSIINYELGLRQPVYANLEGLASYFDVSTDYIMGIDETNRNMITIPREEYDRLKNFEQTILNKVRDYERGD